MSTFPKTLAVLESGRREGLHPGAQCYVSLRGETLADLAIGEARVGVPMQRDTLTLWLSSGKPLTAVAIAQSYERGRLSLDDVVGKFIPEFARHGKESVTVRHLLTHTGGFRTADKLDEKLDWEEMLARIYETPLEPGWVPGEKAGYHIFSSWLVLGEIVRRLGGRPFTSCVREEIFAPLGMSDSWLAMPPEAFHGYGARIGVTHLTEKSPPQPHPYWDSEIGCAQCRPGGSARGPIRELGRFYEALLGVHTNVPAILKPETIREFTSRQRAGMFDRTFQHVVDCGLGFILNSNRHGAETVPYGYGPHASEETFGHSGVETSCAFADPAHGLVVAWMCNGLPGRRRHQQRARAINAAVYEDLGLA